MPSRPSDEDADVAAEEDAWRLTVSRAGWPELGDPRGVSFLVKQGRIDPPSDVPLPLGDGS